MALTELQQTCRRNVIESLKLTSSRDEQLEYQRQVPIAYVSAELFCWWGDDAYNEELRECEDFRSAFSASELVAIENFNQVFERICASTDPNPPYIEEFILSPEWAELSGAAATALLAFEKNEN